MKKQEPLIPTRFIRFSSPDKLELEFVRAEDWKAVEILKVGSHSFGRYLNVGIAPAVAGQYCFQLNGILVEDFKKIMKKIGEIHGVEGDVEEYIDASVADKLHEGIKDFT